MVNLHDNGKRDHKRIVCLLVDPEPSYVVPVDKAMSAITAITDLSQCRYSVKRSAKNAI